VVDNLTKLGFAYPVCGESVEETKRCVALWLKDLDELLGRPAHEEVRALQMGQGPGGHGDFTEWMQDQHDIKVIFSPAWRPQSNSRAEVFVKQIKVFAASTARIKYKDERRWVQAFPAVVKVLQTTWTRTLTMTPLDAARHAEKEALVEKAKAQGVKNRYTHLT
jgi:hypothetical protein